MNLVNEEKKYFLEFQATLFYLYLVYKFIFKIRFTVIQGIVHCMLYRFLKSEQQEKICRMYNAETIIK